MQQANVQGGPLKIVVIGGQTGGTGFISQARRFSDDASITLLERGEHIGYVACCLAYYLGGVLPDRETLLPMRPDILINRFGVDVRTPHEVVAIDRDAKIVEVRDMNRDEIYRLPYDKLVLATGASPACPDLPGFKQPGVFMVRNIADVDAITAWMNERTPAHAVVIGAGFIGLEVVENLKKRGIKVSIVERAAQIMPRVDTDMASLLYQHLISHGIEIRLNQSVTSIAKSETGFKIETSDGAPIDTEMVIVAAGLKMETTLARSAGLKIGDLGGIQVDEFLRTSDPDIYAVGDAIQTTCAVTGAPTTAWLAVPISRQTRIAAAHIFGREMPYGGTLGTFICKVFDLAIAMTGVSEERLKRRGIAYRKVLLPSTNHIPYYPGAKALYLKLLFCPDTGKVLGAQAVGEEGADKRIDVLATAITSGMTVHELEYLELCYAPPYGAPKDAVNLAGAMAAGMLRKGKQVLYAEDLAGADDVFVLDVRTAEEFQQNAIPGAVNIPDEELRGRLTELPKDKRVAVCCQIGSKANAVQRLLSLQGYDAYTLMGGYLAWMMVNNCLPTEKSLSRVTGKTTSLLISDDRRVSGERRANIEQRLDSARADDPDRRADQSRRVSPDRRETWRGFELDVRGLSCPGPIVKVRDRMKTLEQGEQIRIHASDPAFPRDLSAWCDKTGHLVIHIYRSPTQSSVLCEKGEVVLKPA